MNIFYGICGEGMGHSGRSVAMIERLTALGHRVKIFTFGNAFELMTNSGYQPHRIEGLQFREAANGAIHLLGSLRNLGSYFRCRGASLDLIRQLALVDRPELFLTDFEPLTALAAHSLRVPCFSIDNQHRFCHPLGGDFPPRLRAYGRMVGHFVRRWIKRPQKCIVAVFHHCPSSRHYQRVDVLLRDRIASVKPRDGEHVLLYARGALGRRMARIASTVAAPFIAYGCEGVVAKNIEYKRADCEGFAADLASCKAVLCAGGQQLLGEAAYFGKPLLIVPIPKQHEQEINARFALRDGLGDYCPIEQLTRERIQAFVERRPARPRPGNGIDQALELMGIGHG